MRNDEFIKTNRMRPDTTGAHQPQHIKRLSKKLGESVAQLRAWRNKRANGTRAKMAIEKTPAGWRLRPQYKWVRGSTMHLAVGLNERNGGLANHFKGGGVIERYGLHIARYHDPHQGMWMYAIVDPHYQRRISTTSPKGAFLRIWDRGCRGMAVVFDDFYDQPVSWHYWGPGIGTKGQALADARRAKSALEGGEVAA